MNVRDLARQLTYLVEDGEGDLEVQGRPVGHGSGGGHLMSTPIQKPNVPKPPSPTRPPESPRPQKPRFH